MVRLSSFSNRPSSFWSGCLPACPCWIVCRSRPGSPPARWQATRFRSPLRKCSLAGMSRRRATAPMRRFAPGSTPLRPIPFFWGSTRILPTRRIGRAGRRRRWSTWSWWKPKTRLVLKISWPYTNGKGIHSPTLNRVAAIDFDGQRVWDNAPTSAAPSWIITPLKARPFKPPW